MSNQQMAQKQTHRFERILEGIAIAFAVLISTAIPLGIAAILFAVAYHIL